MPDRGDLAIFGCGDTVYHLIGVRDCLLRSRPMRESGGYYHQKKCAEPNSPTAHTVVLANGNHLDILPSPGK
jgi:hypothetical protein